MASFFVFKVRSGCTECGEAIMIDGPSQHVKCNACHSILQLAAKDWTNIFDFRNAAAILRHAAGAGLNPRDFADLNLVEGQTKNSAILGGTAFYVQWGPQRPLCGGCGALLDLNMCPPGTDGVIICAHCRAGTSSFPPPPWLRAIDPSILQLFGATREDPTGSGALRPGLNIDIAAQANRPVSFTCPECGGNLKITMESPRILGCSFCKADLFLPDPLWRALHPVKKRAAWYVAFA